MFVVANAGKESSLKTEIQQIEEILRYDSGMPTNQKYRDVNGVIQFRDITVSS